MALLEVENLEVEFDTYGGTVHAVRDHKVDGDDIRGREIGMIFQDHMSSLNPTMTVGNQIAKSLQVHQGMSYGDTIALVLEPRFMVCDEPILAPDVSVSRTEFIGCPELWDNWSMNRSKRYSLKVRERAVRMVFEHDHRSQRATILSVAGKIDCEPEMLHRWVRQTEVAQGARIPSSTLHASMAWKSTPCTASQDDEVVQAGGLAYPMFEAKQ